MDDSPVIPQEDNPVADPKDRTREQFEKLTTSNSSLKEENDIVKSENEQLKEQMDQYRKLYEAPTNQTPNANQYSNLNQQQVNDVFAGMVDQNGFLDGNKLATVLTQMDARAKQAEERAQRAETNNEVLSKKFNDRSEEEAQNKVYTKYPQLNPDNKEAFDPKMWRHVYNELAVKAKAGQNPSEKDYMDAADQVYSDFYADSDMTKRESAKKIETETTKQQINAVRPTSNMQVGYYAESEEQDLLNKVREGKRGALAEILNRRGQ